MEGDHLGLEEELDSGLLALLLEERGDLGVHRTEDLGDHLHDRHIDAHGGVEAGKLHTDDSSADDEDRPWELRGA